MEDCSICLSCLDNNIYALKCTHEYHKKCISKWLKDHDTCPLCRTYIAPEESYVSDGILTEEKRLYLQQIEYFIIAGSSGLERIIPELKGFTEHISEQIDTPGWKQLLNELYDNYR
uniref:Putative RING finger E3 ubiquitin ligase n=1 Tax=Marseillevirus LCMAC201 TaxID=2506605 RepID=A0A481YXA5_9VIRU|nr:MAG: putative RING finger E3 ubiquitin ligase [Marseillevirus LCMAC201]